MITKNLLSLIAAQTIAVEVFNEAIQYLFEKTFFFISAGLFNSVYSQKILP